MTLSTALTPKLCGLIDRTYASIDNSDQWHEFLALLVGVFPGIAASLAMRPRDNENNPIVLHLGYPDGAVEKYISDHLETSPWNDFERLSPVGVPYVVDDAVPLSSIKHTAFYKDWCVPYGLGAGFGVKLFDDAAGYGSLFIDCSPALAAQIKDDAILVLSIVAPHMRRAVELRSLLKTTAQHAVQDVLKTCTGAAFIVDADCAILESNPAAAQLILDKEILKIAPNGRLAFRNSEENQALNKMLRDPALQEHEKNTKRRWLMPITLDRCTNKSVLEIEPLQSLSSGICDHLPFAAQTQKRCFLLSLRSQTTIRLPKADEVQSALGLSELEALAITNLIQGQSIEAQAAARNVKADAIRWHFRNIYQKLGCSNQVELTCLVMSLVGA
jgi:Bacterial regulatory proteins, luxR family